MFLREMNILVVHETEYIDKVIYEYQIIPEILSSRGHNVYVIDFPTHWSKLKIYRLFSGAVKYINVRRTNKLKGVTVLRPAFVRIPVISRISAFFLYFFLIHKTIRDNKISHIILFSVPTNGLSTIMLARWWRIPVLYRSLDVSHEIVPHTFLKLPTILLERFVYKYSNRISAITHRLIDYVVANGASPEKCFFLPTGADADVFYYQSKDKQLLANHGLSENDLIMLFSGTLYRFSGLKEIICTIPSKLSDLPGLKLLLVGGGEQYEELKKLVNKLGLQSQVILTGFVDYSEVPKYINLADICINPFVINDITDIIFPSKIYQYLACEKPVIATKLKGMLDIFPPGKVGSGVYYFDTLDEFFDITSRINRVRVKSSSPSLQEITTLIELELGSMRIYNPEEKD
jgi:glycosyltransferase involved in cell wall biosynthesis